MISSLYFFIAITVLNSCLQSCVFAQDPLLKMSDHSECIRQVVDTFIKKESCQKLSESQKSMLAIKMTNCLNIKLGKTQIPQCQILKQCKIQGDDWDTFTTFFTHIDNLCHFYWDLLHHQRTERLVQDLSQSAILSENILKKNYKSTQQILSMQQMVQQFMSESISQNKKLSQTLSHSQIKLLNMTSHLQIFLHQLNGNIVQQYASIINVMQTINKGIEGMGTLQNIMMSEISSISGLLYFFVLFISIGLLSSFRAWRKCRIHAFATILVNIIVQILIPQIILAIFGVTLVRIFFVLVLSFIFIKALFNKNTNFQEIKEYMDGRLQTKRIKRIFKQIIEQRNIIKSQTQEQQK